MQNESGHLQFSWSSLNPLQVGRYAEHLVTMEFVKAGLEVYTTEVDDRGIDLLVRYAPGRCLEVQVKAVRNRNLTFVVKKHLGRDDDEVQNRLQSGYCMAFVMLEDNELPHLFLIPGYAWLEPNDLLKDNPVGDKSVGPYLQVNPTKRAAPHLEQYRFSKELVSQFVSKVSGN